MALSVAAIILCLSSNVSAKERVIILAPAAADVLNRLNTADLVVGVTNSVTEFPAAQRIGTHRAPEIETIAALKPTLLITTAEFDPALAVRLNAQRFVYAPQDLGDITAAVRALAVRLNREHEGTALAEYITSLQKQIQPLESAPTVLYEVRAEPLSVAGSNSIIRDLLEKAGLRYAHTGTSGLISVEYLLAHQPDYYIYQVGPMNKNPTPPRERPGWADLKSCVWRVDELEFARPNIQLFETLLKLNRTLHSNDPCPEGQRIFSGE